LALAALALVVFGAYDSYPSKITFASRRQAVDTEIGNDLMCLKALSDRRRKIGHK